MGNYQFVDLKDELVKEEKQARKIKFKNISFTNIGKKFDQFRINRMEKKLVKAKQTALDTQLFNRDMKNDGKLAERILLNRTRAVAKLEAKINFLETGNYISPALIESRAIKLKDVMKKNLDKNVYGLFSIPEDKKEYIFENKNENVESEIEKTIREESEKLNNKIMSVQQEENTDLSKENIEDNFENITIEEAKETVDKSFDQENKNISEEDIENVINIDLSQDQSKENNVDNNQITIGDNSSPISPIEDVIIKEMPEIPLATIKEDYLKGINDNIFGRNSINENVKNEIKDDSRDLPIVVPERENINYFEKTKEDLNKLEQLYQRLSDTSIEDKTAQNEIYSEIDNIENEIIEYKEKLTDEELSQLDATINTEEVMEEETEEENIGFDYSETTVADMEKAIEETKSTKELNAMLDRINMLKQEEARTQERVNKAKEEEEEKDRIFNETMTKFIEYGKSLTEKCNKNLEAENEIKNKAKEKEAAINSMLAAMKNEPIDIQQKKK